MSVIIVVPFWLITSITNKSPLVPFYFTTCYPILAASPFTNSRLSFLKQALTEGAAGSQHYQRGVEPVPWPTQQVSGPKTSYGIVVKSRIAAQNRYVLGLALGNEHAIEG